jgi:hypothetical protein
MTLLPAVFCLASTLTISSSARANEPTPETGETRDWESFVDGVMAAQKEAVLFHISADPDHAARSLR